MFGYAMVLSDFLYKCLKNILASSCLLTYLRKHEVESSVLTTSCDYLTAKQTYLYPTHCNTQHVTYDAEVLTS